MLTTPVTNYTHIPYTLSPWFCSLIFKDFEKIFYFFRAASALFHCMMINHLSAGHTRP